MKVLLAFLLLTSMACAADLHGPAIAEVPWPEVVVPPPKKKLELYIAVDRQDVHCIVLHNELEVSWRKRLNKKTMEELGKDFQVIAYHHSQNLDERVVRLKEFVNFNYVEDKDMPINASSHRPMVKIRKTGKWQPLPKGGIMIESTMYLELMEYIRDEWFYDELLLLVEEKNKELDREYYIKCSQEEQKFMEKWVEKNPVQPPAFYWRGSTGYWDGSTYILASNLGFVAPTKPHPIPTPDHPKSRVGFEIDFLGRKK